MDKRIREDLLLFVILPVLVVPFAGHIGHENIGNH